MKQVAAVSAGADRIENKRDYFAPVVFRITYEEPMVREAAMICVVSRKGDIVDAHHMPADESVVTQWTPTSHR